MASGKVFTAAEIDSIKHNLTYNYKILDRVLICLSIKSMIMNQPENGLVDVLIDEAAEKTLIYRLYAEDSSSHLIDQLKTTGNVPAELILEKMKELFKLDDDILLGKRKLGIGIDYPDMLTPDDNTLADEVIAFNQRHPEWAVELFATDTNSDNDIREAVRHILRDKEIYMKDHRFSSSPLDELLYNPIGIDGIRAFMYVIDNGMIKLPLDTNYIFEYFTDNGIEALIEEFIEQNLKGYVKREPLDYPDILMNRKKNKRLYPALIASYEQYAKRVFNQIFIFDLFIQIERKIDVNDDFDARAYKPNVYCLDSLIHYIADSTFDYFYGYRDKGNTVWGFLKQIDTREKLNLKFPEPSNTESDPLDVDLTDIDDYIDEEELDSLYEKLTLSVPAPLKLNADSELLKLIVTVEDMGYLTTLSGSSKEFSLDSVDRPSKPKFNKDRILI